MSDQLFPEILKCIKDTDINKVLSEEHEQFIAKELNFFVRSAIGKFIKGQKEHGGRLQDRDLDAEIYNEMLDLFWYNCARNLEESPDCDIGVDKSDDSPSN